MNRVMKPSKNAIMSTIFGPARRPTNSRTLCKFRYTASESESVGTAWAAMANLRTIPGWLSRRLPAVGGTLVRRGYSHRRLRSLDAQVDLGMRQPGRAEVPGDGLACRERLLARAAPGKNGLDRLEQDPQIQPERHVLEVVEVVADLLHLLVDGVRVPIPDLRPPGDPGPDRAPERVVRDRVA